jgi:A/G-specific adenine glycosylase
MELPAPAPLHRALLAWFDREQRPLPWRETKDPYAIWVSEVMLQQTQVDRVIPYWSRFLARFPTVTALAEAPLADVLAAWRGLGYYSRARNLHRAAQHLVREHGAALPSSLEALLALPGFGRYTAGAVASIAFGQVAPLVDGNVARVLARLLEIDGRPPDRAREAALWTAAGHLVHRKRPGDWNQALMELGATVCLPRNPLCLLCPLRSHCRALATDRVDELPAPRKAPPRKRLELAVLVARRGDQVLLARREEAGLFGGLWEMPMAPCAPGGDQEPVLRAMVGKRATIGPELSVIERTLTHRDLVLRLFPAEAPARLGPPPPGYLEWRWVDAAELPGLGISSAMEQALAEAAPPLEKRPARGPR